MLGDILYTRQSFSLHSLIYPPIGFVPNPPCRLPLAYILVQPSLIVGKDALVSCLAACSYEQSWLTTPGLISIECLFNENLPFNLAA